MSELNPLIELLSAPGVHSGTELGEKLGISRVAIKKRIDRLAAMGFPVETVANRGYRIHDGVELLSHKKIASAVEFENPGLQLRLEVFQSLDSTNSQIANTAFATNEVAVAITESQPMGQGRRGRSWVASPYRNLMLSIGYKYPSWPENPAAISLAFSVAVHRALVNLGVPDVQLKWPNDLNISGRKLGGLLVSASGETGGELMLTLGVGINLDLDKALLDSIDQPAVDLRELGYDALSRNRLAADIISNTTDMLDLYPQTGFKPFMGYWNEQAIFSGEQVRVFDQNQEFVGELRGVNEAGELCLLMADQQVVTFSRSELSLRRL